MVTFFTSFKLFFVFLPENVIVSGGIAEENNYE